MARGANATKRAARTPNSSAKTYTPASAIPPPRKRRADEGEALRPTALFSGTSPDLGNDSQMPFDFHDTLVDTPDAVLQDPYAEASAFFMVADKFCSEGLGLWGIGFQV